MFASMPVKMKKAILSVGVLDALVIPALALTANQDEEYPVAATSGVIAALMSVGVLVGVVGFITFNRYASTNQMRKNKTEWIEPESSADGSTNDPPPFESVDDPVKAPKATSTPTKSNKKGKSTKSSKQVSSISKTEAAGSPSRSNSNSKAKTNSNSNSNTSTNSFINGTTKASPIVLNMHTRINESKSSGGDFPSFIGDDYEDVDEAYEKQLAEMMKSWKQAPRVKVQLSEENRKKIAALSLNH
eukprot:m.109824 g.109824  ORF g.109824 m.109824 type:complete len:245 (-) comp27989_c0_seq1:239-973(-)